MNISVIESDRIKSYEPLINQLLERVFDKNVRMTINEEFSCATLVWEGEKLVACGFAYQRTMEQNRACFIGGIVGGIAVDSNFRGMGLAKTVLSNLDVYLVRNGIHHCFLFAYEPDIYLSSGYKALSIPINYFDETEQQWNEYVYRGGMTKSFSNTLHLTKHAIHFKGCVY